MSKVMLGLALGLLAAHLAPSVLDGLRGRDPSGAGGQLSQFS